MKKKYFVFALLLILLSVTLSACWWEDDKSSSSENVNNNEVVLPPPPGEEGKLTLEGVDFNDNEIRDDIEIKIHESDYNEETKLALTQYAKAEQDFILSGGNETLAVEAAFGADKVVDCIYFRHSTEEARQILEEARNFIFNTDERIKAYLDAELLLVSSGYSFRLPSDEKVSAICK